MRPSFATVEIYILRHAIAVERGAPGFGNDRTRTLTPDGRRKFARAIRGMKALKLSFDHIVSSPYLRARETAEMVARQFKLRQRLKFSKHLEPDGDPKQLLRQLERLAQPGARLVLVGHEPDLSRLAARLIGGSPTMRLKLKKGGLCKLVADDLRFGACAEMEWLLTPRQLIGLG